MKATARRQPDLPLKKRIQNAPNRARPHESRLHRRKGVSATAQTTPPFPKKKTPDLELYQSEEDAFSHIVRAKLSELGLDYLAHSVPDGQPLKHEKLVQAGGKDQIPFLIDRRTGIQLYHAKSIITYLEHEYGKPAPNPVIQLAKNIDMRVRARADRIAWRLRMPLEKLGRASDQIVSPVKRAEWLNAWRDSVETLRGTYRTMRKAVSEAASAKRPVSERHDA